MVDHAHGIFGESASEPGKGGMIGRRLIEGKSQKRLKGGPVVDLRFQLRIGVDSEPLLEQEAFHQDQRRVSLVAFGAFADGIVSQEEGFDSGPIHNGIDLLHSFDGPVAFQRRKQGDIGEGEVCFHFLEAHRSSKMVEFEGNMAEKREYVKR
ncbi:MAG: hypothetical protein NTY86_09955 [Deltaproteobacteria bacterium]|nr:hypothetical protein [Deltaproteobacteria bacterium]